MHLSCAVVSRLVLYYLFVLTADIYLVSSIISTRICCQSVNSANVLGASSKVCSHSFFFAHAQFLGTYLYMVEPSTPLQFSLYVLASLSICRHHELFAYKLPICYYSCILNRLNVGLGSTAFLFLAYWYCGTAFGLILCSGDWWYLCVLFGNILSQTSDEGVPVPVVMIDQDSDRDSTIVQLSFGDRLGALLDTV